MVWTCTEIDERRLKKQFYKAIVSGRVGKGQQRRIYHDQLENVLKKKTGSRVSITKRTCMKALIVVDYVKDMCQDCSE